MKIVDEINSDFIELELLEVLPDRLPTFGDRNISIEVKSRGFWGRQTVWLDYYEIQKFISEINVLEEQRKGEANITSMSFNQFLLHIGFYDELGHVYFKGYIAKRFEGNMSKIAFYIRPDTSLLNKYVYELNCLLTS